MYKAIKKNHLWLFVSAGIKLVSDLFYFLALQIPGVMISLLVPIKRLSTLFTTLIGGELFHDHGLKTRLIGCIITIIGVLMVVL